MVYLLQGNAKQLFTAFKPMILEERKAVDHRLISLDLTRSLFLGGSEEADNYIAQWLITEDETYTQGQMTAGNLYLLLHATTPLIRPDEQEGESYRANLCRYDFAFLNQKKEPCGFMLLYRKDNPGQWVVGIIRNNSLEPEKRNITLLASFDLSPHIKEPVEGIECKATAIKDNILLEQIDHPFLQKLFPYLIDGDTVEVNERASRLLFLLRALGSDAERINLAKINLDLLFAPDYALDILLKYRIILSGSLLMDCLDAGNPLKVKLETAKLHTKTEMNERLLNLIILFYQHNLLQNELFDTFFYPNTSNGFINNDDQMKLLPFLVKQHFDTGLLKIILDNETRYYQLINLLVELNLTLDISKYLRSEVKLEGLRYIQTLNKEMDRKICLVFWAKSDLTDLELVNLAGSLAENPLLASTLLTLSQSNTISTENLYKLALDPKRHRPQTLRHHFGSLIGFENPLLLEDGELDDLTSSLTLLSDLKITNQSYFQSAATTDESGHLFRLLLPALATLNDRGEQLKLVHLLYKGIYEGEMRQGKIISEIKDPDFLALAIGLRDRFLCAHQMQALKMSKEIIAFTAEINDPKAIAFRHIIFRVENECKAVQERVAKKRNNKKMIKDWQEVDKKYRIELYKIAFNGLTNQTVDIATRLNTIEKEVLATIDPKINSIVCKSLIIIANIIITALTLGLANEVKRRATGNYWFFNQTTNGEKLRALDEELRLTIKNSQALYN